ANSNAKITINLGTNATSGMGLFSSAKKKTTITIHDDGKTAAENNTQKHEAKAAAKAKANMAKAEAKARAAEKRAKKPKPNVFQ
ncbi:MAG: hypothetical protein WCR21_11070, partial [Bacteroidota bacterium]